MRKQIPSLRGSLVIIFVVMGVIAVSLTVVTSWIYQDLMIENQRAAINDLVKLETGELMEDLYRKSVSLGLSTNKSKTFRQALESRDKRRMQAQLDNQFHQYFVTAGIIQLEKLILYDKQINFVTESSEGLEMAEQYPGICENLVKRARVRTGPERLKPMQELCVYENKPYLSVIVAIGGLIPKAYLQVVTDPSFSMKELGPGLGLPVHLSNPDGEVVFESEDWPKSKNEMEDSMVAEFLLHTSSGEVALYISAARDMRLLYKELDRNRLIIITAAVLLTFLAGLVAIYFLGWTTLSPMQKLQDQIRRVWKDREHLGEQVDIKGGPEVIDLTSGFNKMTAALNELYQELESEITERVSAEQASKSKTDFLSRMSHEFRTPLNAILGFTELLLIDLEGKLAADQQEQLRYVYEAGMHLLQLVNELLDLESIEAGKIYISSEAVEVNSVINDALHLVETAASRREIKFEYNKEGRGQMFAEADPSRLKQVFINLLSNAVKYNKTGGKVIIDIIAYDDMYKFSVMDEGGGMTQDQLKKVFDPFVRVGNIDEAIEGTGIGLTITKRFVELMGGEMGVNSSIGAGSEFWFTLPIYKETKHA